MNIYLVSRTSGSGYDTFSDFVCTAPSEEMAKLLHPRHNPMSDGKSDDDSEYAWVNYGELKVTLIGKTHLESGITVLSSFHAG